MCLTVCLFQGTFLSKEDLDLLPAELRAEMEERQRGMRAPYDR